MVKTATITSKRQITIPADIFRKANLKEGQKVLVQELEGEITLKQAKQAVEKLAGSVKVPARFKNLNGKQIVNKAKKEYFSTK